MTRLKPFGTLTGIAAPLIEPNIDTDIIIPSREMKSVTKDGLRDGLFAGRRYLAPTSERRENPDFVLNQTPFRDAEIILGGPNFGCGSSREHAVWALGEYGIRAVLAPSFSGIFYGNCIRNGLLPVRLDVTVIERLAAWVMAAPAENRIGIDLAARKAFGAGAAYQFEIEPGNAEMLLEGLDAIDLTLKLRPAIEDHFARDRVVRPWAYPA